MTVWLIVILLAAVQGITEFLPVSSSGHLAVLGGVFGLRSDEGAAFSIVLHAGSLLAIVAFYFKTLLSLLSRDKIRVLGMVLIATIPAGVAGLLLKKFGLMDMMFSDLLSIGMAFLVTASLLRITGKEKMVKNAVTPLENISLKQALIIGFVQMIAIVPGISRSGATIAAGVLCGLQFESAAAFSFLLAIPAIGGAMLLELFSLVKNGFVIGRLSVPQIACGFGISALVSFAALTLLVAVVKKRKLSIFSWYLFLLGITVVGWQMLKLQGRG